MSVPTSTIALDRFTSFGDLLKYLRRHAGLTQRELSIAVGYSDTQISRLEQNERLPDLGTLTARFLPALHAEDEPEVARRLLELAAAVRREDAPAAGQPPFKGLYYFDEGDAELFFGRENLTEALAARLLAGLSAGARFLAVVGASGSGKSSIIRAGLIPALRWNSRSSAWPVFVLTPTAHPLEALAAAIATAMAAAGSRQPATGRQAAQRAPSLAANLAADLAAGPRALHEALQRAASAAGSAQALLVVDQFEELFTLCRGEAEQAAFVANLLAAAAEPGGPGVVVIALRADFYAHAARFEALREALAQYQAYIGPMTAEELRRAIEEPARRGQWKLEAGLVELLLQDVGADAKRVPEPGALPLLSHALLETWQRRRGRNLTLAGYTAAGGVGGAIAETAEAVFHDQLDERQRGIARQVFLRLTEFGADAANADTRRRVSFAELLLRPEDEPRLREVLQTLADARLITTGQDGVEVAHEALIREWPTLRGWLEENREGLRLHRRLTEAAQEWDALGRDAGGLYRGARLAQALEWAEWSQHGADLNDLEREFLRASQALAEREAAERDAQRQRELEAAQALAQAQRERAEAETRRAEAETRRAEGQAQAAARLRARNRLVTAVGALALLAALFAGFFGLQSSRNATGAQVANTQAAHNLATAQAAGTQSAQNLGIAQAASTQAIAQRDESQRQARLAFANQLAAQGISALNGDMSLALLLSVEANRTVDTYETRNSLFSGLTHDPHLVAFIHGHTAFVTSVAFSPDGKIMASGSADNTIRLWDVATRRPLGKPLTGSLAAVLRVAFSPDGKLLASGGKEGTVRLWDVATGRELGAPLEGHTAIVTSVAFSPDGKTLASGSDDKTIVLSDVATGQPLVPPLAGHTDYVTGVAFSPDGKTLASSSLDGTLRLWDTATGQPLSAPLTGHLSAVTSVAFSPDGKTLASGSWDHSIILWDAATHTPIGAPLIGLTTADITSVAFSPDGTVLASGSADHTITLWDMTTSSHKPLDAPLTGHADRVLGLAFSPDGKFLVSGSADNTLILWSVAAQTPLRQLIVDTNQVTTVTLSPDGKTLAWGDQNHSITLWDRVSQQPLGAPLVGHTAIVNSLAFSPDGKMLASGDTNGEVRLWDVATGRELGAPLSVHVNHVTSVAFSPDGKIVALGSWDHSIILWDLATHDELGGAPLIGHTDAVPSLAFSPDGGLLASASDDRTIRLWDVATGRPVRVLAGHTGFVYSVAFSPDGKTLVSGGNDRTIRVWDVATGRPLGPALTSFNDAVFSVAVSPDGKTLAASVGTPLTEPFGHSNNIPLLDLATLQPLAPPLPSDSYSVAFSPDGNTLLVGLTDGNIELWDISIADWQARACAVAGRNLTQAEWNLYLTGQAYRATCAQWPAGN